MNFQKMKTLLRKKNMTNKNLKKQRFNKEKIQVNNRPDMAGDQKNEVENMAKNYVTKTSFSIEGWNFKDWLLGNGKTIKELAKVGIPAVISFAVTNNYIEAGFGTILGKFLFDTLEYYIKERVE